MQHILTGLYIANPKGHAAAEKYFNALLRGEYEN